MPITPWSLLSLVVALFPAGSPDPALADWPILESRGPSSRHFPEGSRLPDDAVILLRVGDVLVIERSVGPVTYRGPAYFRLRDEPAFRVVRRGFPAAGADPGGPPPGRWLPPVLAHDGPESVAEQGAREGFIICPGHARCPAPEGPAVKDSIGSR